MAQNKFPSTGNVGIGTNSPNKLLDVNGKSVFRDKVVFKEAIKYQLFKDTTLLNDRILSIAPNGKVRPLRTAFCDSMMIAKLVKVGDSSIWIGEEPGGENAIWSTNGPLMLNSNFGMTNEDVYIASQDNNARLYVGHDQIQNVAPPLSPINAAAIPVGFRLNVISLNENAICGTTVHPMGTAICAQVNFSTARFFRGSVYNASGVFDKIYIDGTGDVLTMGDMVIGQLTKIPSGQYTAGFKMTIVEDQATGNGYLYSATGPSTFHGAFTSVTNSTGGYLIKHTTQNGSTFTDNVYLGNGGELNLYGNTAYINVNGNFKVKSNGYVYAREIVVMTGTFPDYVFKDDYNLMPLEELKKYIVQNEHLPGVPTAETVLNENLKLKEMNLLLLEKVEELTLYLIQLNDKIDKK